ncbi:MAG TPA: ACT domain-containing protein [archaeon]|nr:ACT domain-containing protein [archaeon]
MFEGEKQSSLSELVRKQINSTPHVKNSLGEGVINYSALARKIMPTILKKMNKKINEESLVVAIKRYADELGEIKPDKSILEMFANAELSLQDNMAYAHFKKSDKVVSRLEKLFASSEWNVGELRIFIQGAEQAMVITKKQRLESIFGELQDEMLFSLSDSALVTFRLSASSYSVYGVIAEITRELAKKGISIEVITTPPDLHFLVDEKDAEKTYTTLKELIREAHSSLKEK